MKTNIRKGLLIALLILICIPLPASSASYDQVPRKFAGWGTSTTTYRDRVIDSETIVKLDNLYGSKDKTWSRTVTTEKRTEWSGSISSSISSDITLKVGITGVGSIGGGLAGEIRTSVGFNYAYTRRSTDQIQVIAPPGTRIQEIRNVYGDRINAYAKHFVAWVTTKKVSGNIYTPRYFEYVSRRY